ncbi:MAG: phytoene dehydrogenase [Bacteroidetes bacterium]|nr:MAG: phytoene dehydrogenase [Bacteroidota bacterium]
MAKVIILGGGVAGMSAAHELIERGFEVEVYERHKKYPGGKARSVDVSFPNLINKKPLPGEHGFRFFPGFYKHVIDTMKRIPVKISNGDNSTVFDNLVSTKRVRMAREGKKSIISIVSFPKSVNDLKTVLRAMHSDTGLTQEEESFFAKKVWQLMTSCYERRTNDYERISWWDYTEADRFSDNYKALFVQGLTRTLVAANAKKASTKTGGDIFLQLIFNMANPTINTDRVLNGPTNDAWLYPWLNYLINKGVKYFYNHEVTKLEMEKGKISGARVVDRTTDKELLIQGDYYLLALPVERAARLMSDELLAADSTLEGIVKLSSSVAWMNGAQYYLTEKADIVDGHCIYSDSKWALTSISQLQFWKGFDISLLGDGNVKTILSVDISDWDTAGHNGMHAKDCTHEQIKDEIWKQISHSLNTDGEKVVPEKVPDLWHIDGDIKQIPGTGEREENEEPLLVNTVNSWVLRPESYTAIPNLFLAADYVRTYTDLATMEGANEAARRAVNGIIDSSGVNASQCELWNLHEPEILNSARRHDEKRYKAGLPYKEWYPWWMRLLMAIFKLFKK